MWKCVPGGRNTCSGIGRQVYRGLKCSDGEDLGDFCYKNSPGQNLTVLTGLADDPKVEFVVFASYSAI